MGTKRAAVGALAGGAVAAAATALALALGPSQAGAAAVLLRQGHTFTATSGARVTCDVWMYREWLDFNAKFRTELHGPEACRATEVVVGWNYTDTAGVRHRGREIARGGRVAEAAFSNVADDGQQVGRHRVEFAGCVQDCTFGPYEFDGGPSSK